jgi:DNA-binding transcriptional LysR family regulator
LELRQLETFVRIASTKNFTKAANDLSLTQPAVTRQIAALEKELHTRLLDRMGRHVELTSSGIALHSYAVQMLRLADDARRSVHDVTLGSSGQLSVGASSTAATYLLPPMLRRFREEHSGVELSVHTGSSAQATEMVSEGSVDMSVVMDFRPQRGIHAVVLANYANVLVTYPDHPLAQNTARVAVSDLSTSSIILMQQGTRLRLQVDRLFNEAQVAPRISMELDNVEAIKKMIEARLGVSILPYLAVTTEVTAGSLRAITLRNAPAAQQVIAAVYREDKYQSASLKAFVELLKEELSTLADLGLVHIN